MSKPENSKVAHIQAHNNGSHRITLFACLSIKYIGLKLVKHGLYLCLYMCASLRNIYNEKKKCSK